MSALMISPVANAVRPAVDARWTEQGCPVTHNFAAFRPQPNPPRTQCRTNLLSIVMGEGYEPVHSIHRAY